MILELGVSDNYMLQDYEYVPSISAKLITAVSNRKIIYVLKDAITIQERVKFEKSSIVDYKAPTAQENPGCANAQHCLGLTLRR